MPTCAIVGPRILDPDGSVQGSARGDPGHADRPVRTHRRAAPAAAGLAVVAAQRRRLAGGATSDASTVVDWVSGRVHAGAARARLRQVDGFDERYFLYWEDADLCRRLRAARLPRALRAGARPPCIASATRAAPRGPPSIRAFHESAYLYYATHVAPGALNPKRWLARVLLTAALLVEATPVTSRPDDPRHDLSPIAQACRQPWRFDARRLNQARIAVVPGDQEIGERLLRRVELRPDAAAAEPQIVERQLRQQLARRLEEVLDRDPIVLVVVLAVLEADGRAERDVAVDRSSLRCTPRPWPCVCGSG